MVKIIKVRNKWWGVRVSEGSMIPPWHGVAFYDFCKNEAICYPIPFNLLIAIIRYIYIWLRHGGKWVYMNPRDAFHQGVNVWHEKMEIHDETE